MGILDRILGVLSRGKEKKEIRVQVSPRGKTSLKIEEVDFTREVQTPKKRPQKKTEERMREVDEKKKFMEVVNLLRKEAGLPPVEEKKREPLPQVPPSPLEVKRIPSRAEVAVQEKPPQEKPAQRPPSKAEVEKVVKVVLKRVETNLLRLVEEDLRKSGVKSFKELAMSRRKAREYLRGHAEELVKRIANDFLGGRDVRSDTYALLLAKEIYPRLPIVAEAREEKKPLQKEERVRERKEEKEKKEEKEEDLLSLLEGGEEKKEEEEAPPEEEDLLKLLES